MKNKRLRFLIYTIIIFTLIFTFKTINEYRERNFADLINYKSKDNYLLSFTKDRENIAHGIGAEWWTNKKEPTNELIEFLSQYQVKKVNEETFKKHAFSYLNKKETFEFTITHMKKNPVIVFVSEDYAHIFVGDYYKIINGPIDMKWIKKFNEKNKELYTESS